MTLKNILVQLKHAVLLSLGLLGFGSMLLIEVLTPFGVVILLMLFIGMCWGR